MASLESVETRPIRKLPPSSDPLNPAPQKSGNSSLDVRRRKLIWVALLITVLVHGVAAWMIYVLKPTDQVMRRRQPLEMMFLAPPAVLPPKPVPPPPPRPKVVKVEPKPVTPPPPIAPAPVPETKNEVVNEEPPLPVAPPPPPEPAPVEVPQEQPVEPPEYNAAHLHNPPPPYPPMAKRLKIEGTVLVKVLVSPAGLPQQIELARSSGSSILDDAALKGVKNWAFIPARKGTEAIAAWVEIPIHFHLLQNQNKD